MDEKKLIKGLIANKENAVRYFVETYQDIVFKTCLAYTQNDEDAADLSQEVFMKALNSISSFQFKSKLSSWVVRIAINHSLNHKRSAMRVVHNPTSELLESKSSDDSELTIEEKLEVEQVGKALQEAIRLLPENQSKVFILKRYHDYSYKEISEITGLSHSAIDSLLSRAKQNLQKSLLNFYKENYQ